MKNFRLLFLLTGILFASIYGGMNIDILSQRYIQLIFLLAPIVFFYFASKNQPSKTQTFLIGWIILVIEIGLLHLIFRYQKNANLGSTAAIGKMFSIVFMTFFSLLCVFIYFLKRRIPTIVIIVIGLFISSYYFMGTTIAIELRRHNENKVRTTADVDELYQIVANSNDLNLIMVALENPNANEKMFRTAMDRAISIEFIEKKTYFHKHFKSRVLGRIQKHTNASHETKMEAYLLLRYLLHKDITPMQKCEYLIKMKIPQQMKESLNKKFSCTK